MTGGRRGSSGRALAALAAGAAIGATSAGGTALLLYTGQGFIRAAGLLVASTVMSVAAGVWAGVPLPATGDAPPRGGAAPATRRERATRRRSLRWRWALLVVALLLGGMFTAVWSGSEAIRALALGGALAVFLVLALPGYAAGSLLSGLHGGPLSVQPGSGTVAAGALAGVAIGIMTTTGMLMQTLPPSAIYYGAAALLACIALFDPGSAMGSGVEGGFDMTDHITLITGVGARGQLGYTVARAFLDAGASVTITARNRDVEAIADELRTHGTINAHAADLLDDAAVAALIAGIRERHGRLDSLINLAGGLTVTGTVEEMAPERWRTEIERNAETVLRMSRAALPMLRDSTGSIVNFASPAAVRAPRGMAAYAAAKAAVVALTQALAAEEKAHGLRVNAIAPGVMDTQQNRAAAGNDASAVYVTREEVADVVLFLAGRASRGISGQTIHVPGATLR